MGLADKNGLQPQLFVEEESEEEVNDITFYKILKQRNPKLFDAMNEEVNRSQRMQEQEALRGASPAPAQEIPPSFLDTPAEGV